MRPVYTTLFTVGSLCLWGVALAGAPKEEVCHLPPGNPDNWHTIQVSEAAVGAHEGHGDLLGSCDAHLDYLCDDGDACTIDHAEGECSDEPAPVDCNDSNEATADDCDPTDGCQNPVDDDLCFDGVDGDGDGLVDCDDPDCADYCSDPNCDVIAESVEVYRLGWGETLFRASYPEVKYWSAFTVVGSDSCTKGSLGVLGGFTISCECSEEPIAIDYTVRYSYKVAYTTIACSMVLPGVDLAVCEAEGE